MKKIMFYILVVICLLLVFLAFGAWMFGLMFNDTGSTVMGNAFNTMLLFVCVVCACTMFLVFWKSGFVHSDTVRIIIVLIGIVAMCVVAFLPFVGIDKKILAEQQSNENDRKLQLQTEFTSHTKDYICGEDGAFLSLNVLDSDLTTLDYYPNPNNISTSIASIHSIEKNFKVERRDVQTKKLLSTCKNAEGKILTDSYTEETVASSYKPKTFPIDENEAIELVKQSKQPSGNVVKIFGSKNHDDYSNQDYWLVQSQSADGNSLIFYYLVFINDGKIITGGIR